MVEPVTVGKLVAETLSVVAKAGLNGEAGEAVKDGYKALKEKVSHWASSDVVALEATLGSIDRQVVIAKIIDAQSEEDRTSLRVLAEALVTKLKECAPAVGLDIGRLTALEAQLAADDTEQPAQADGGGTTKEANAPNGSDKSAADDASPATTEQVEALFKFRKILTELVSRTTDNLDNKESPSSARNPFVILVRPFGRLVRWFQREPGFEETVANYASMLPILETSSGWRYSEVALIGIMALQAGKLEVAKTVNAEVRFQTTTSAALGPVIEGVGFIVLCLVILSAIVAGLSVGIVLWNGVPTKTLNDYYDSHQELIHSIAAFGFGCFGSVVSLLSRLGEFNNNQGRSMEFLRVYSFTLPIVGGVFAVVLAAVLDAKIISILENRTQLFIVIGFLAGFSERFTQKILNMVEGRVFKSPA